MLSVVISIIVAAVCFIGPLYIMEVLADRAREKFVENAKRNARRWASPMLD